jgi:predicted dehydrogenase
MTSMTSPRTKSPRGPEQPLGVAVVGCGYWGVNYIRILSDLPGARLVAACEPRQERLDEIVRRFPEASGIRSLDALLERDDVDAVVIATAASSHFEVTRRCLEAGKHVLVEKPLATEVAEGAELVRVADDLGLVLMVGHTFVYNPSVARIKAYVDAGTLGSVYYLYSRRTNLGPVRQDVNALWDLAPHDVSIFNHVLGASPEWVSATGARVLRNGREDVGFITLGYPGGVVGNVHVSWADPSKVREVVVVGSEGRLVFDDLNQSEPLRLFEKGVSVDPEGFDEAEYPLHIRDGDIVSPRIVPSEPLKNQCRHFVDCIVAGAVPATEGRIGVEVIAVMEAIDRSLHRNGAPVAVGATLGTRKGGDARAA